MLGRTENSSFVMRKDKNAPVVDTRLRIEFSAGLIKTKREVNSFICPHRQARSTPQDLQS